MFDRSLSQALRPLWVGLARPLVRWGVQPDQLTWLGAALGGVSAVLIGLGHYGWALPCLLLSRVCDGLDGTLARLTQTSDRGAFLDIALDFAFYASVPLAFACADPVRNALPAAVLLASFIGTSSSFLAFAVMAERRGLQDVRWPDKGLYFLGGLTEGSETLALFVGMLCWPEGFPWLAMGFALLCVITWGMRLYWGWRQLD